VATGPGLGDREFEKLAKRYLEDLAKVTKQGMYRSHSG
jgi:hypothetical protein